MPPIQYIQVDKHPLSHILAGAALVDHVPQFDGTAYVSQYPIAALNAGTALGRVSEINITGTGGLGTVSGKRLTINVDKGVNARSVSPSVGVYQAVSNIDFGAGFTTSFGANTVTVSTTAATPQISLTNNNAGVGIVTSPGTNSAFVLKSLVGAGGTTVQDMGSYIQINSTSSGGSITLGNTGTGAGIVVASGTGSSFSLKGLVGVNGITVQDFGNYLQINGAGVGGSYTHPSYTPQTFTPTLVGTTLTVAGFSRDAIGSVDTITPYSFTLPSGGGGSLVGNNGNGLAVTANTVSLALANNASPGAMPTLPNNANLFLNGVGGWTTPTGGGGGAVNQVTSGNPTVLTVSPTTGNVVITPIGQSTTLNSAWNSSTRILSIPVGVYQGGILTSSTLNQFDLTPAVSASTVEVRFNDVTVNPAAYIVNFKGPGVQSVTNGIGVEVYIPGAMGGGGIAGISINGIGTYPNIIVDGAGVSVSGNHISVLGAGLVGTNGNGLVVGSNSVTLNLATIGSAGAMPALTGFVAQYLSGAGTWQIIPNLPSANVNETLRYNGSAWEATTAVRSYANGDVVLGSNARFGIGNASNTFQFGSNFSANVADTFTVRFQTPVTPYAPSPGFFSLLGGGSNSIVFQADLIQSRLGFFGAVPVLRPSTTNDITSVRNALVALGLIS